MCKDVISDEVFLPLGFPPRDADFVLQLAVASKCPDIKLGFKRLQLRGGTVQNVFSRFCACAMRNTFFLAALGAVDAFCILSLPLRQCCLNPDVLQGHWLYFSMLATLTVGESLLKKRHIPCIFLAFQRRHFQMYKQYAKTVRMPVTKNEQRVLKPTTVSSSFLSAHAP